MRPVRARARVSAVRIMLAAMSAVLLLSGCHVPGTTSASGNVAVSQTITVAMVPGIDNAPLLVAQRDGLFRKQGLDVVIKSYPTLSAVVAALSGGQAQIAAGDYTAFLYQQATGGLKLRLVADGYDAGQNMLEILTLPGSGITDPQQLVGKTVATPEKTVSYPDSTSSDNADLPYNIETLAAQTVLESDNVSPTAVNWTPIPPSAMIGELRSGKVSAILAPEPYVFEAEAELGAQEVLDACSGVTAGLPLSGYFSKASYDNSAALARFRTALLQAQADSGMRGPLQAVLPSAAGISAQDAALVTLGTYPTSLSVGQVQRVAQLMFEAGMIGSTVSVRQLAAG